MSLLAISDGKLQIGDVVEIVIGHAPYTVTRIESDMYFFSGQDGEFSTNSGYVYLIGKTSQVTFYRNGAGTIHATVNGNPLCGHRFTSNAVQVAVPPTCENCRKLLD